MSNKSVTVKKAILIILFLLFLNGTSAWQIYERKNESFKYCYNYNEIRFIKEFCHGKQNQRF